MSPDGLLIGVTSRISLIVGAFANDQNLFFKIYAENVIYALT